MRSLTRSIEKHQRRILKTPDAALYVGAGIPTMEKWRLTGEGPRFVRLGPRAIGYDIQDLDAWIESRKRQSTSAKVAKG
jgi:predicted DNA-binding transcriptional regulator AlpA